VIAILGVGVQSTLGGGKKFLPEKYVRKINIIAEFYTILVRKKYQNTRIFMTFASKINKIPEFCLIFAQKCPNFAK